jgi:hypothetical protein
MRKLIRLAGILTGSLFVLGAPAVAQSVDAMSDMMISSPDRGMMSRFSAEDMSAFVDAHIAALKVGLKLTAEQDKLWPPVEDAMRNLGNLHLAHMMSVRQDQSMIGDNPVGVLRSMADRMGQGSEAVRRLADAAAPLYAMLDDTQKRRLHALLRAGICGSAGAGMMRGRFGNDDSPGER